MRIIQVTETTRFEPVDENISYPPKEVISVEVTPILGKGYSVFARDGRLIVEITSGEDQLTHIDITTGFLRMIHDEILVQTIVPWVEKKTGTPK